jgi:ectoine hydroxylase-related dioxygenase (phytanoyl-CoA dioxygenase family)
VFLDCLSDSSITRVATQGYAIVADVLENRDIEKLSRDVSDLPDRDAGTRRLLDAQWCVDLAERLRTNRHLCCLLPTDAHAVQCTLFVKSTTQNWLVALHQDLSIPVAERVPSTRCSGWSEKEGDLFVQPPVAVLEQLLAVRLHLDDCNDRNGALRVVPGSHRLGRLSQSEASRIREQHGEHSVPVPRGGAMVMRPLLLHASSKATIDARRRVLHFVFGPSTLPDGLLWPSRKR